MSDEPKPTKEELRELGKDIELMLRPLKLAHPGLVYAVTYGLPRESAPDTLAAATLTTEQNPERALVLIVAGAKHIQEQIIDPFYIRGKETTRTPA